MVCFLVLYEVRIEIISVNYVKNLAGIPSFIRQYFETLELIKLALGQRF